MTDIYILSYKRYLQHLHKINPRCPEIQYIKKLITDLEKGNG